MPLLNKLYNLAVHESLSITENRKTRVVNISLIMLVVTLLSYITYNLLQHNFSLAFYEGILTLCIIFLFYLQHKGYRLLTRNLLIASLQTFLSLYILFFSPGSMGEYLLLLVLFLELILYHGKLILLFLFFYNLILFYLPQILFQVYPEENFSWANPLVIFVALPIAVYFIYKSWNESEKKIQQKNDALMRMSGERTKLVSIVAHDLKSPLSRIEGLINIFDRSNLTEDQLKILDIIEKVSVEQKSMIQKVLSLQDEGGEEREQINLREMDIIPICHELAESMIPVAHKKDISINVNIYKGSLYAMIEPTFLSSCIENLLSNAIKFSPSGSAITFELIKVQDKIIINVIDQGPGISKEDQAKLFQPNTRLSAQPTGGESSNGLGLSITKYYVQKMGGEIKCRSQLGVGSIFSITLKKSDEH